MHVSSLSNAMNQVMSHIRASHSLLDGRALQYQEGRHGADAVCASYIPLRVHVDFCKYYPTRLTLFLG